MRPFRHRVMCVVGYLTLVLVVTGCTSAATPPVEPTALPSPTTAVVASPLPTNTPDLPPPTETTAPPTETAVSATEEPEPTVETDFTEAIALYKENGCIGCHTLDIAEAVGTVGPPHNGVGTTAESRITEPGYHGDATTAEEYIRESIMNPTAFTVPDYPEGVMPSFATIGDDKIDKLVEMLLAQK